jgi:signal transduction histidine kinase
VVTDRTRLSQVLGNVVNNAIKFTDRGSIDIRARGDAKTLEITVTDTGMGIPLERLPQLFTRFHAVSAELVHSNQGAGLGLPLAKELMTLLGGNIDISSVPGQGTQVTLTLPVNPPQAQDRS